MMRRSTTWVAGATALALTLAACGGDDDTGGSATETASEATGSAEASSAADSGTDQSGSGDVSAEATGGTGDAGATGDVAEPTGDPIKVLYIGGITGALSINAADQTNTLQAAFDVINGEGGLLDGRPLELETADSALDPTQAVSALQEALASDDPPDLVFAGTLSSETLAMLPVLTDAGIMAFCTCNASPINDAEQWTSFIGGFSPTNQSLGVPVAERIAERGFERVAVLYGDDASAVDWFENGLQPELEAAGIEIVASESVPSDSLDYTPAIEKLRSADPDVFVARAFGQPAALVLQAREQTGFDEVQMIADPTFSAVDLSKLTDISAIQNMEIVGFEVQVLHEGESLTPSRQELVDALEPYGGIQTVMSYVSHVWDGVFSFAAAVEAAGTLDTEAVRAEVFALGNEPNPRMTFQDTPGIDAEHLVRNVGPDAYTAFAPAPFENGVVTVP